MYLHVNTWKGIDNLPYFTVTYYFVFLCAFFHVSLLVKTFILKHGEFFRMVFILLILHFIQLSVYEVKLHSLENSQESIKIPFSKKICFPPISKFSFPWHISNCGTRGILKTYFVRRVSKLRTKKDRKKLWSKIMWPAHSICYGWVEYLWTLFCRLKVKLLCSVAIFLKRICTNI